MSSHEYEPSFDAEIQESLPTKERYIFNCKAITITGRPGSGQSSTGRELAETLQIDFYDVGRIDFRTQEDIEIIDYLERPLTQDMHADEWQEGLLKNATPYNPPLLVSRLSGIITNEIQEENVVNIFISCPRDIRYRRILEREKARGNTNLTQRTVGQNTRNRERSDRIQWEKVHPQLAYIDPYNPNAKDENGNRIYRYVVSSAKHSSKEVTDEIIRRLIEDGLITKVENKDNPKLPSQGTIFEAN